MLLNNLTDTQFFARLDRTASFIFINLLWVLFALPVVTLPIATAGLFAVITDWQRGIENEAVGRFFGAMRQYWRKSTLLGLLNAALFGLIAININILPRMALPQPLFFMLLGITLFVGVLAAAANLYLWTLLVVFDLSIADLIEISVKLVFQHSLRSGGLLATSALAFAAGITLLPSGGVLLVTFAGCAWLVARGAWCVIGRYASELDQLSLQRSKNS
ncbi:MAG: DUF624 domain-containing protein [Chloroflexi bacterium]|nr:DUF624 domain-containing protein [Chloroflexota bacterium]